MAGQSSDSGDRHALEEVAGSLVADARRFTPVRTVSSSALPGRTPGVNLAARAAPQHGPAAVLLDIGTSRRAGFTHVLWVSTQAENQLGPTALARLGEVLRTIPDVQDFAWEGDDALHLLAPGATHEDLLRDARLVVAQLLA